MAMTGDFFLLSDTFLDSESVSVGFLGYMKLKTSTRNKHRRFCYVQTLAPYVVAQIGLVLNGKDNFTKYTRRQ